jgi:hypothetical protein
LIYGNHHAFSLDGKDGLPPHIPPDTALTFDVTLLGYRARSQWVKPLIQDTNTSEKPHQTDLKITLEMMQKAGMKHGKTSVFSTSLLVLREEDEISMNSKVARLMT